MDARKAAWSVAKKADTTVDSKVVSMADKTVE